MSKKDILTKEWISKIFSSPGALRQKAKAAGIPFEKFIDMNHNDPITQRQVNLACTLRKHSEQLKKMRLWGILIYGGRRVNPDCFRVKNKDFRRLVGYCFMCGKLLRGRAAIPQPDPFCSDVHHDNTPIVMCENCRQDRADEI